MYRCDGEPGNCVRFGSVVDKVAVSNMVHGGFGLNLSLGSFKNNRWCCKRIQV